MLDNSFTFFQKKKLKFNYFSKAGIKIHLKYPLDTAKKKFYQPPKSLSPGEKMQDINPLQEALKRFYVNHNSQAPLNLFPALSLYNEFKLFYYSPSKLNPKLTQIKPSVISYTISKESNTKSLSPTPTLLNIPNCIINGQSCNYLVRSHIKKLEVNFNEFENKKKELVQLEQQINSQEEGIENASNRSEYFLEYVISISLVRKKQLLMLQLEELQNESQKLFEAYKNAVKNVLDEDMKLKQIPDKLSPRIKTIVLKNEDHETHSSSSSSNYYYDISESEKSSLNETNETNLIKIQRNKAIDFRKISPRKELFTEKYINKAEFYNLNRDIVCTSNGTISKIGRNVLSPFQSRILPEINKNQRKEEFLDVQAVVFKVVEKTKQKQLELYQLQNYKPKVNEKPKQMIVRIEE